MKKKIAETHPIQVVAVAVVRVWQFQKEGTAYPYGTSPFWLLQHMPTLFVVW